METNLEKAYRVVGSPVNIAAAGAAAATVVFIISNFAQQIGTKSFRPKKLLIRNNAGGNLWLALGTGVGGLFVSMIPAIRVINNFDSEWSEYVLPSKQFHLSMTAYPDALVAGGSIDVQVEVEEIG